jgi:hypothetical protein
LETDARPDRGHCLIPTGARLTPPTAKSPSHRQGDHHRISATGRITVTPRRARGRDRVDDRCRRRRRGASAISADEFSEAMPPTRPFRTGMPSSCCSESCCSCRCHQRSPPCRYAAGLGCRRRVRWPSSRGGHLASRSVDFERSGYFDRLLDQPTDYLHTATHSQAPGSSSPTLRSAPLVRASEVSEGLLERRLALYRARGFTFPGKRTARHHAGAA